jgi:hypothetical protein
MHLDLLNGWVPVDLYWQDESPVIDWGYLGERRFTHPFFNDTISESFRHPFAQLFRHQTSWELLHDLHQNRPGLSPTGFIFHMSRCGSTLVSQMLASLTPAVMLSEPPPVDQTLRARFRRPELDLETRAVWLRSMVNALGQKRSGDERYLFVKFDCWSILDFETVKQAYPDVPWIFLFRDPVRVLASQFRHRGKHMVPGVLEPELFGFAPGEVTQIVPEEYGARVLAAICRAALSHRDDGNGMFINYTQLPDIMWSSVLEFFQMNYGAEDLARMKETQKFDAKNPSIFFDPAASAGDRPPSDSILEAADKWVGELYDELQAAAIKTARAS